MINTKIIKKAKLRGGVTATTFGSTSQSIIESTGTYGGSFDNLVNTSVKTQTLEATNASINNLRADDINTTNINVLGSAFFNELVINKVNAVGGSILLTPVSEGFVVEKVKKLNASYQDITSTTEDAVYWKLYWRASEGRENQWLAGDLALCMNYGGGNANNYYWALVTNSNSGYSPEPERELGNTWYIIVSATDKDGSVLPQTGDNIVMCGNRNNPSRQGAILISTNNHLDTTITPPFVAQYTHIDGFLPLLNYRDTWFSGTESVFNTMYLKNSSHLYPNAVINGNRFGSSGVLPYVPSGQTIELTYLLFVGGRAQSTVIVKTNPSLVSEIYIADNYGNVDISATPKHFDTVKFTSGGYFKLVGTSMLVGTGESGVKWVVIPSKDGYIDPSDTTQKTYIF